MSRFLRILSTLPGVREMRRGLDNQHERDAFVEAALAALPPGSTLLDAGCGSQRYRKHCNHLQYRAQDFGQYKTDAKRMLGTAGVGGVEGYTYGPLDYVGDIWNIDASDRSFDAVLCTEVFEHIPHPNETLKEFSRLFKPGGLLILTAPSNCLRHMDPYFFYSGFSDRWYEKFLPENGFDTVSISPVGDYYSWLSVEMARAALANSFFAKLALASAFLWLRRQPRTPTSVDTLCMGYHVLARRRADPA